MPLLHSFKSGFRRTGVQVQGTAAPPRMVPMLITGKQTGLARGKCRPPQLSFPWLERFVSHHASSEQHSGKQPPANTESVGCSWLGCFWKAKQLKEIFPLIERGFLGPLGQFWRPESVQRTGSHLCFSVPMLCCFTALANVGKVLTGISKGSFWSKHIVESRPLVVVLLHKRKEGKHWIKTPLQALSQGTGATTPRAEARPVLCPATPATNSFTPPRHSYRAPCQPSTLLQTGDISQGWLLGYFVEHSLKRRWKLPPAKSNSNWDFSACFGKTQYM